MQDWNKQYEENMKQATEDGPRPPVYALTTTPVDAAWPTWNTIVSVNNHGTFVPKSKYEQTTEASKTGVWMDAQVMVDDKEENRTLYLQGFPAVAFLERVERGLDLSRPFGLALVKPGFQGQADEPRKSNGALIAQGAAE